MRYQQFWRRAVRNLLLGVVVSIVPGFAFYYLAFDYTPEQLRLLAWLAIPGVAAFLTIDLLLLAVVLRPLRRAMSAAASEADVQRGIERLPALPVLVLPRVFGPHAISATLAFTLLVIWANRTQALGIPESHFPLYWILNLTVVPLGHAVYEYHATERLIQQPLSQLSKRVRGGLSRDQLVRLPLASRIFLFSVLLGLAPPVVGGFIVYQRTQSAGLELAPGFLFQLAVVGAALTLLWLLLVGLVSREIGEQTRSITAALDRIAAGDLRTEVPLSSTSELGRIALAVNDMTAGLRERKLLKHELAVGRHIQQSLLPKSFHQFPHFRVTGINQPCLDVGGDYFDLMKISPDRAAFVIADVSGKGLGAALVTAMLQGTFSAMTLGQEPASVFTHINRFICEHSDMQRYATLFFGILDTDGRLVYVNAGHPPPLLVRNGSADLAFEASCPPIGLLPDAEFSTRTETLRPGDTLVLYTDGVTEAFNAAMEQFGLDRLQATVTAQAGNTVEELQNAVIKTVGDFIGDVNQADDFTLLILRYIGNR